MKNPSTRTHTLKHLPFFEVLADAPEGSAEANLATAGLLTLRMIDHWVLAGPPIVEPESVSVRSVRQAIMALPKNEPIRESLLTIVNTMQMLRQVDLIPVLPRVFAYAQILERHYGSLALAGDAYESVVRLADPEFDAELCMDAHDRLAFCQRKVGELDLAESTSRTLIKIANRKKDRARVLRGKIHVGIVAMMRGNLDEAESQFIAVENEARGLERTSEVAAALQNRAVVASRQARGVDAVLLSHHALKYANDPVGRERIMGDLAAYLILVEQYNAAIDALRIIEVTAVSDEPRQTAKANLLAVAVRMGDQELFESVCRDLEGVELPIETRINVMIETARGLQLFGLRGDALELLDRAEAESSQHALARSIAEIRELRAARPQVARSWKKTKSEVQQQTSEVAGDLRRLAASLLPV